MSDRHFHGDPFRRVLIPGSPHYVGCRQVIARTCTTPVECEHGYDCCPICDPCTCDLLPAPLLPEKAAVKTPVLP